MWICGGDPVGNSDCGSGLWPGLFFSGLYRREKLGLEKLLANGISSLHHHNGAFFPPWDLLIISFVLFCRAGR